MLLTQKKGFSSNRFQSRMAAQPPCRQRGSFFHSCHKSALPIWVWCRCNFGLSEFSLLISSNSSRKFPQKTALTASPFSWIVPTFPKVKFARVLAVKFRQKFEIISFNTLSTISRLIMIYNKPFLKSNKIYFMQS